VSLSPNYSKYYSELQYVSEVNFNGNDRYIFASIHQNTISTSVRVNLNLSPNLTLQYWGQPFIASGKYYNHKYIVDPMADRYTDRFRIYSPEQISLSEDQYLISENGSGTSDYSFDKSDFKVQEFLSNLVVRWEYNPGSTIYLVWSQTRSGSFKTGSIDAIDDLGNLFDNKEIKPHNVFLVKFSYRFGIR
jgi:hypothetical protein